MIAHHKETGIEIYGSDDLFVISDGECFCRYCFIITCIIDLRLGEGLMMLTVIYFVLVQPLDDDDRGIIVRYKTSINSPAKDRT